MRCSLLVALALAGSALALPGSAAAQGPSPEQAAILLRLGDPSSSVGRSSAPSSRSLVALPDSVVPKRKNYTVAGLLIGAGLGFAAGWAFYDAMCEAVDNKCLDPRTRVVVIGTAAGAGLGALIGSLVD